MTNNDSQCEDDLHDQIWDLHDEVYVGGAAIEPWMRETATLGLRDNDPEIRWASLDIVSLFGMPQDAEIAREMLDDEDSQVRMSAVTAIGELCGAGAKDEVLRACSDVDPYVRREAYLAFGQLSGDKAVKDMESWLITESHPAAVVGIVAALVYVGQRAYVRRLAELASHSHPHVSSPARWHLVEAGLIEHKKDDEGIKRLLAE